MQEYLTAVIGLGVVTIWQVSFMVRGTSIKHSHPSGISMVWCGGEEWVLFCKVLTCVFTRFRLGQGGGTYQHHELLKSRIPFLPKYHHKSARV